MQDIGSHPFTPARMGVMAANLGVFAVAFTAIYRKKGCGITKKAKNLKKSTDGVDIHNESKVNIYVGYLDDSHCFDLHNPSAYLIPHPTAIQKNKEVIGGAAKLFCCGL